MSDRLAKGCSYLRQLQRLQLRHLQRGQPCPTVQRLHPTRWVAGTM